MADNSNLKKSALSGAVWKFTERALCQVVSLVVSILLARLLAPEDYSVVGIVTIFFTFCNIFIAGGFGTALIQKKDADGVDYSTVFYVTMAMATLLYGVMFFTAPAIAGIYGKEILVPVIRTLGIVLFINGVKSVLISYTSSTFRFKRAFIATFLGTAVSAVVGIVMASKGFGVWALVAQQLTAAAVDTVILVFIAGFRLERAFSFQRLKSLFSYGWKIFLTSVITTVYEQLNPLVIGMKFAATDLAFYTKGNSFPSLLNSSISDTLATVLFPVMAKVQSDTREVLDITRRYIKVASFVVFPLMAGLFAVSRNFVTVLLTEKWLPAVVYMQIFCISYMFNIIQVGNLQAIKAIGRSDVALYMEIVKKSLYFIVVAAFVFLSDQPEMLALSSIVCTLIASVVNTFPNRRLIGYRYRYQLSDILPNLILSILMGATVLAVGALPLSPVLLLPLQILAGILTYLILCIVTRNENFYYLIDYVKLFLKKR